MTSDMTGGDAYESYDDDFGGNEDFDPSEGRTESDDTMDQTEAVAAILRGEDLDPQTEATMKSRKNREWSSRPLDGWGNTDWSDGGKRESQAGQQADPVQDTIYASQVREAQSHAQSEWDAAHAENERLNDLFASGQMSAEEHYRLTLAQGQRAGAAKEMMYQSTIAELMHGRQLDEQNKALEKALGDAWKPENRQQTTRDLIDWAEKSGLSRETLANVETEAEAMAIYNAMKNEKELEATKLELKAARQMLKKQHQELGRGRKRAAKSHNMGNRHGGSVQEAQLESIVDILNGAASSKKGGRR